MSTTSKTRTLSSIRFWFAVSIAGCASFTTGPRISYRPGGDFTAVEQSVDKITDRSGSNRSNAKSVDLGNESQNPTEKLRSENPKQVENLVASPRKSAGGPRITPQGVTVPAQLELTVQAPERKQLNSGAVFRLTIQNIGDLPAEDVVIESHFDDALVFPGSTDTKVQQSLGRLVGNESKEITLTLVGKEIGTHQSRFSVTSKGSEAVWKSVSLEVVRRQMNVRVVGPTERTFGSRAEYLIELINVSPVTLHGIRVRIRHDSALQPREATDGVIQEKNDLSWRVGDVIAGEGVQLQVEFECRSESDEACLQITLVGENLPTERIESCLKIKPIKGILDVRVEDKQDPVSVGNPVDIVATIQNRGLHEARDIAIAGQLPSNLEFDSIEVRSGDRLLSLNHRVEANRISLDKISSLPADALLTITIHTKAIRAGDARFQIQVSHSASRNPVTVSESTTINPRTSRSAWHASMTTF